MLDATAREDFIYKLMEDRAVTIPTPPGVRDYGSVTLHVARTSSGIGKGTMVERAKTRFSRLIDDLTQRLGPERKMFICVHKQVEHEIPEPDQLPFAKTVAAHWGAVDGSNAYADCDAAVIFGLPFRDAVTWPTNVYFALKVSKTTIGSTILLGRATLTFGSTWSADSYQPPSYRPSIASVAAT